MAISVGPCRSLWLAFEPSSSARVPRGIQSYMLLEVVGRVRCMQVWSTNNIEGVHRFLARVYRLIAEQSVSDVQPSQEQMRLLHATIKKVCLLYAPRPTCCLACVRRRT